MFILVEIKTFCLTNTTKVPLLSKNQKNCACVKERSSFLKKKIFATAVDVCKCQKQIKLPVAPHITTWYKAHVYRGENISKVPDIK